MNTIEQMIHNLCPEGVKRVRLGELEDLGILILGRGKVISKEDIRNNPGNYPVYSSSSVGDGEIGRYGQYMFDDERISWSIDGGGKFFYRNAPKYSITNVSGWLLVNQKDKLSTRFLYYALFNEWVNKKYDYNHKAHPSIIREEYSIPLPPLEIQGEIVKILDRFAVLTAELEAELEARRKQYEYYRTRLLSFAPDSTQVMWKALGEIANIGTGTHNTKDGLTEGTYPFYTRGIDVLRLNSFDFEETALITAGDGAGVGKVIHYVSGKYALHQRAYRIVPKKDYLIPRFLYYYMRTTFYDYIMGSSVSSSVTSIRMPMLMQYLIPIPSLAEQERIVNILDKFDQLVNGVKDSIPELIDSVQKQYEYYRNKLLTFPEA